MVGLPKLCIADPTWRHCGDWLGLPRGAWLLAGNRGAVRVVLPERPTGVGVHVLKPPPKNARRSSR